MLEVVFKILPIQRFVLGLSIFLAPRAIAAEPFEVQSARSTARAGNVFASDDRGLTLHYTPASLARHDETRLFLSVTLENNRHSLEDSAANRKLDNTESPKINLSTSLKGSSSEVFWAMGAAHRSIIGHATPPLVGSGEIAPAASRLRYLGTKDVATKTQFWLSAALRPMDFMSLGLSLGTSHMQQQWNRHRFSSVDAMATPLNNPELEMTEKLDGSHTRINGSMGVLIAPYSFPLEFSSSLYAASTIRDNSVLKYSTEEPSELQINPNSISLNKNTSTTLSALIALRYIGNPFSFESHFALIKNFGNESIRDTSSPIVFNAGALSKTYSDVSLPSRHRSLWKSGLAADIILLDASLLFQLGFQHVEYLTQNVFNESSKNNVGCGLEVNFAQMNFSFGLGYQWSPSQSTQTDTILGNPFDILTVDDTPLTKRFGLLLVGLDIEVGF